MGDRTALVLVENEVTVGGKYDFWNDDTGVQYHYPNQYRNRVRPGREFVYYRGVRRTGGRRGTAEYFGSGMIGEVWQDPDQPNDTPAAKRRWLCSIQDYVPFDRPVPAKDGGKAFEKMPSYLGWRTGVREIPFRTFEEILSAASAASSRHKQPAPQVNVASATWVERTSDLLLKRPVAGPMPGGAVRVGGGKRSTEIGTWGEELIYLWLEKTLPEEGKRLLDWVARRGETPGWDIEYKHSGDRVAIEVKATTVSRFTSITVTSNEWDAAKSNGKSYGIALVVKAMSPRPGITILWDPYAAQEAGSLSVEPIGYSLIPRGLAGAGP
jgi:Domain of unknown function (DUF3883)